jgi:hypothetical protein
VNTFDGVDIAVNARFGKGGVLSGGVSSGKTISEIGSGATPGCFTIDAPHREGYCRSVTDWQHGTQVKLLGNYPLPWWGIQVSATFQNLPGPSLTATRTYLNAEIAPSLGRSLSAGAAGTAQVALLPPNSLYEPRFSQTDLRFAKRLNIQRLRVQGQFDVYNLFNSSAVLAASGTFGANWLRPSSILGARLIKFGVQVDWH